jgi:hypothetical protein
MPDHTSSLLFLAVPGTQETRQLDLESVRDAVARGEIGLDNWAWSADRNEWVPLAQLPEFAAPAPAMAVPPEPMTIVRVEPKPVTAVAAPMKAQAGAMPHAATYFSKSMDDHPHEAPVLRILFIGLGLVIVALVVVNYFLIEQPFRTKMATTPFADVSAHAHLGAFMQPTALLIHVLPNAKINSDNFADLLTALAQSAPRHALPGMDFKTVSLTPGWLGRYLISSDDWAGFADMSGFTPDEKRQFVLTHVERGGGAPLLTVHRNETLDQRNAEEDAVWRQLVATFHGS